MMGQVIARKEIEEGLRLYNLQQNKKAVRKWKKALRKLKRQCDRFTALSYLASAHMDTGRYRDTLAFALQQIDIANEAENTQMKAEAYMNLARSNERLCEYHKAVSYSRHSLQNIPKDPRVHGYVYLCQGNAYFGFSNYTKALENYEQAMKVARQQREQALELQIYSSLGNLFCTLKDYDKGLALHLKALDIAKSFNICDPTSKFQRMTTYNLVNPYRKLGRLEEAMEHCEVSYMTHTHTHTHPHTPTQHFSFTAWVSHRKIYIHVFLHFSLKIDALLSSYGRSLRKDEKVILFSYQDKV